MTVWRVFQARPLTPGVPYFTDSATYGKVNITWKENDENVEFYQLQSRLVVTTVEVEENAWTDVYQDSANHYIITGLYNGTYAFRVRAKNRFGYSNFSEASEARDIEKIRISQGSYYYKSEQTIVGALIAGGILFAMLLLVTCLVIHKNRR